MGTPVTEEFPPMYWITLAVIIVVVAGFSAFSALKNIPQKTKEITLKAVAIFQLTFEVAWRIIYVCFCMHFADMPDMLWPMYPCNLGGILVPLMCILNWKPGKGIFYLFGFTGAVLTFVQPGPIFSNTIFVFPILKSMLQHTGLLLIPTMEYAMGKFRPSVRQFPLLFIGCVIQVINGEGIARLFSINYVDGVYVKDYVFLKTTLDFGLPVVPTAILFSIIALSVFFALSFLTNIKESIETLKNPKLFLEFYK